MLHFTNFVSIRRPPVEVFAYLADFGNVPQWNYAIAKTWKTSPGPVGVGSTFRQRRTIPTRAEGSFTVTEFAPDSRLAIGGDLGPFHGALRYSLETVPEGTRLTNDADLRAQGLAGLIAPLAASRVRQAVATNLEELKRLLETGR